MAFAPPAGTRTARRVLSLFWPAQIIPYIGPAGHGPETEISPVMLAAGDFFLHASADQRKIGDMGFDVSADYVQWRAICSTNTTVDGSAPHSCPDHATCPAAGHRGQQ